MSEIAIVRGYDWEGLYIDGVLVEEDHRLRIEHFQRHNLLPEMDELWADDDWLSEHGDLPVNLDEVRLAPDDQD